MQEQKQVVPGTLSYQNRPQGENEGRSRPNQTRVTPGFLWGNPEEPASSAISAIGRAYERFLELPVPVVLVVLWLVGALILGAVAVVADSALVWLWLWSSAAATP